MAGRVQPLLTAAQTPPVLTHSGLLRSLHLPTSHSFSSLRAVLHHPPSCHNNFGNWVHSPLERGLGLMQGNTLSWSQWPQQSDHQWNLKCSKMAPQQHTL
eukprot:4554743-Amphidinium_carterae.1